jgi:hypothetical protein
VILLITVACSSGETTSSASPSATGDPSTDKLAQVLARGTLVLFTDPEYAPQSYAVEGAERCGHAVFPGPAHGFRDHRLRRRDRQSRGR